MGIALWKQGERGSRPCLARGNHQGMSPLPLVSCFPSPGLSASLVIASLWVNTKMTDQQKAIILLRIEALQQSRIYADEVEYKRYSAEIRDC